ncbi:MAG: hypothetical protein HC910_04600 [Spirulinaceae cyanobacterium SM2_1_0]|nr:hypothetical protein [Spirulinaceae cyanobacterium SM2_1_0]
MEFNGLTVQRFGVYLTLVSLLPLLAFSTLRFALVDHFGLVSFGGFNIVGIASQMLTKELVVNLPDRDRELAISIIERRDEDRKVISNAGSYPDDHPLIVNNIPLECTRPMPMIFRDWVNCYNYHIWLLSVPLSAERTGHGNIVEVNRELKSLSKHIIAANPKLYFTWLLRAFGDSFFWLPRIDVLVSNASKVLTLVVIMELIFQLYADMASHFRKMGKATLILSLVVLGATTALLAGTGATKGIATAAFNFVFESSFWISLGYILMVGVVGIMVLAKPDIKEFRYLSIFAFAENLYLILIALGYFLFGILLVIAVEPPISRYLMAVYTFFPSLFLVQAYSMVARRFAQFRLLINRTK